MMLSYKSFLQIYVLLTRVTESLAVPQETVLSVEEIRQKSHEYLSGPAYERIESFPKISASVIDMYASFGRLFLNGQLGSCATDFSYRLCIIRLRGGPDANLSSEAATLLSEIGGLRGESPFGLSLPNPSNDFYAIMIIGEQKAIFQRTWEYYGYLSSAVVEAINTSATLWTDLVFRCRRAGGWVANVNCTTDSGLNPCDDRAINLFLQDVAPDCETGDKDSKRSSFIEYAGRHDLLGGDSNKYLQNVVIRSNNYDEKAYEAFVGELDKYLFQDLTLYGLCATFSNVSDDELSRRKEWVKERLTTISSQLLNVREVFKEASFCRWSTSVPVWWSNVTCLPQEDIPKSNGVHTIVTDAMTLYGGGVKKTPGRERPARYKGLIEYVVYAVKGEYENFAENCSVEGVMYLPYADGDKGLYCALAWPDKTNNSYVRQNYIGASYFVKWTEHPTPPEVLRSRIAFLKDRSNEDVAWNAIFNEYSEDLCKQVKTMMGDSKITRGGALLGQTNSETSSGFTAVVAVRCTNEFVWYELGWRYYFAAATTASDYVVSRDDGEYSNSCGQLIFLP